MKVLMTLAALMLSIPAYSAIRVGGIAFDNPLNGPGNGSSGSTSCLSVVVNPHTATIYNEVGQTFSFFFKSGSGAEKLHTFNANQIATIKGTVSGHCPSADIIYVSFWTNGVKKSYKLNNGGRYKFSKVGSGFELYTK